tara:strand:- start:237 stop:1085 length:849 start_codon:yes stop_codon:yes gene_type:complete
MAKASNKTSDLGPQYKLNGEYMSISSMPAYAQKVVKNYKGIVLIRESIYGGKRTLGTLWSRGKLLCFTVEDIPRDIKIMHKTSIPATDDGNFQTGNPGSYYIQLAYTGKDFIKEVQVSLPVKRWSNSSQEWKDGPQKVVPLVSTKMKSRTLAGRHLDTRKKGFDDFTGIFIHHGTNQNSSSGCIIVSRTRNPDGTIKMDRDCARAITKFLFNKKYYNKKALVILNIFDMPKDPPKSVLLGKVKSGETGDTLAKAKILYPEEVRKIKSGGGGPTQRPGGGRLF